MTHIVEMDLRQSDVHVLRNSSSHLPLNSVLKVKFYILIGDYLLWGYFFAVALAKFLNKFCVKAIYKSKVANLVWYSL